MSEEAVSLQRLDGAIAADARIDAVTSAVASFAEEIDHLRAEMARLTAERDEALRLSETCCCSSWPPEGPAPECPVHGAIRAFNEAAAGLERQQPVIETAKVWRNWLASCPRDLAVWHQPEVELLDAVDALVESESRDER